MSSMKNQITEVIKEDLNESVRSNTGRNTPIDEMDKSGGHKFIDVLEVEDEKIFNDSFMQERADI